MQEEITQLRMELVGAAAEREESEQRAAEAAQALDAAKQLFAEQLRTREADLAAQVGKRCQTRANGCRHFCSAQQG